MKMTYENRMMKSEEKEAAAAPAHGVCTCGEGLRYAEELKTVNGTVKNVLYCPNPAAHGGKIKFQEK